MSRGAFSAAVFLVWVLAAGCASHPEKRSALANIRHVAVLPPETKMLLVKVAAVDSLPDEEKTCQSKLSDLIAAALRQRGFVLKELRWNERDLSNPEQQSPYFSWERVAAKARASLRAKHQDPAEVQMLARHTQADTLVFTEAVGFRSSAGQATLNGIVNALGIVAVLAGGPASWNKSRGARLKVALVDGASGQVLWEAAASAEDFQEENLEKMVSQVFKKISPMNGNTDTTLPR